MRRVAEGDRFVHDEGMTAPANESNAARIDDLDLDVPEDREEWRRRLAALEAARLAMARARLQRLGVVDARGERELPHGPKLALARRLVQEIAERLVQASQPS